MRHPWSFRKHLVLSLGLALSRQRALMRRILSEHAPDHARQQLAETVVRHLEQSGYQERADFRPELAGHNQQLRPLAKELQRALFGRRSEKVQSGVASRKRWRSPRAS